MIRSPLGTNCWGAALVALVLAAARAGAEPPTGKEIAEVEVRGNRLRTTQEIVAKMNSRPGQRYSETAAQEDVGRLLSQGWFPPNGVQLATQERPDGKVKVIVQVIELPNSVQKITYRGAQHLSRDELEKLTGLKRGNPMSPAFNESARLAIVRKYHETGRYWSNVRLTKGGDTKDTEVVFDIAEGPVVKVSGFSFEFFGPTSGDVSTGRLRTQLQSSSAFLGMIGGNFNPVQLEMDLVKIADYYHGLGYLDTRVERELHWSADKRTVKVIFHVEEGKRYKVAKVQIDGNKVYDEKQLLGYTDLREGSTYEKYVIQADLKRIRDFYGYQGRPVVARETLHQAGDGIVNVHYQIEEKEPVRVGDVKVYGNSVTRDSVIRRQLNIYPGQILSFPDMLAAEQNLQRLGIFEDDPATGSKPTVEIERPDVDEPFKNILVRVKDKPTGSLMIGAGVTSDAGLTGSIVLNERNFDITRIPTSIDDFLEGRAFRGGGQEFRLEAVPGTTLQRYTASWREPYLFDSRYSLALSGYYFQRTYNEYNEDRVGGRITVGRRYTPNWSANLTTRIEEVGVSSVSDFAPPDITQYYGHHFLLGLRPSLTNDTRDNFLRPTSGHILDVGAEWVTGDYQFPLATAEGTKYWTTYQRKDGSGRHVLAMRSQLSWAGPDTPVYERFYAGGFRSMRGFQFRGVGPYVDGFNVGGNFAWLNSIEYQIPVMANDNLYVVGFLDSGAVERSVEIKDYRVTAGLGLRIAVPQLLGPVPLALDFGFPINQAPGDRKQIFSFWLGFFN
jgi:outer membrane protein insertion porin family